MTDWRPPPAIRPIVIGLAWNDGRLLAAQICDRDGIMKGVRPPGGSIEFGETREEALHREFREELDVKIAIVGPWHVIENIFEFNGTKGHELVFAAEIELKDSSLYGRDEISTIEVGHQQRLIWVDPDELGSRGIHLFPSGLTDILPARTSSWRHPDL